MVWINPCNVCGKPLEYKSKKSFRYTIKHKNKCKLCQERGLELMIGLKIYWHLIVDIS